jgi:hypothetical protein
MSEGIRPAARITPTEPMRVQPTREQANQSQREPSKRPQPRRPPTPAPEAEEPLHTPDGGTLDPEPQQLDVEI